MEKSFLIPLLVFLVLTFSSSFVLAQQPVVRLGLSPLTPEEQAATTPFVAINPNPLNIAVTTWLNLTNVSDIQHNQLGGLQGGTSPDEYYHLNASIFSYLMTNIYAWITGANFTDTSKFGGAPYLYNDTTTIFLNETKLNQTIVSIAEVNTFEENITVTTSGGVGGNFSSLIDFQITRITVYPGASSTYRFEATETTSGDYIDKNRIAHSGIWDIAKSNALNDTVTLNITNAAPDGTFVVKLTYLDNFL